MPDSAMYAAWGSNAYSNMHGKLDMLCCVQEALHVKPNTTFVSCSEKVGAVLGPDVMKSVKPLIPDLLAALPVLLYQGWSLMLGHWTLMRLISVKIQEHVSV